MDAPLLVQPLVLPHESQPLQAHNLEVTKSLPLEFFESTLQQTKAPDISSVEIIKSRLETKGSFMIIILHIPHHLLRLQNHVVPIPLLVPCFLTNSICKLEMLN